MAASLTCSPALAKPIQRIRPQAVAALPGPEHLLDAAADPPDTGVVRLEAASASGRGPVCGHTSRRAAADRMPSKPGPPAKALSP
jgi:hypothetical protein